MSRARSTPTALLLLCNSPYSRAGWPKPDVAKEKHWSRERLDGLSVVLPCHRNRAHPRPRWRRRFAISGEVVIRRWTADTFDAGRQQEPIHRRLVAFCRWPRRLTCSSGRLIGAASNCEKPGCGLATRHEKLRRTSDDSGSRGPQGQRRAIQLRALGPYPTFRRTVLWSVATARISGIAQCWIRLLECGRGKSGSPLPEHVFACDLERSILCRNHAASAPPAAIPPLPSTRPSLALVFGGERRSRRRSKSRNDRAQLDSGNVSLHDAACRNRQRDHTVKMHHSVPHSDPERMWSIMLFVDRSRDWNVFVIGGLASGRRARDSRRHLEYRTVPIPTAIAAQHVYTLTFSRCITLTSARAGIFSSR